MKRSGLFITFLLSLFMFQSVWNVAAAFCVHENELDQITVHHFGHHLDEQHHQQVKQQKNESQPKADKFIQYLQQMTDDDHSDHLPSFAHVFLFEHDIAIQENSRVLNAKMPFLDWVNLYQSPHLYLPKLPPILTPL